MRIKRDLVRIFFGLTLGLSCLAQETVSTRNGQHVVLMPDGNWHYTNDVASVNAESALDTVRNYLSAQSWHDRVSLVLHPGRVKPLMESRYSSMRWTPLDYKLVTQIEPRPSRAGWVQVKADVSGYTTTYYLKITKAGYRIDWESSVGFNPISPAEFKALRYIEPTRFRVTAQLDDYYNYEFDDAIDRAYSIKIRIDGKRIGWGYIDKRNKMAPAIFNTLRDGKRHNMVLDLAYLPNSEEGDVFVITKVVNLYGWLVPDNR